MLQMTILWLMTMQMFSTTMRVSYGAALRSDLLFAAVATEPQKFRILEKEPKGAKERESDSKPLRCPPMAETQQEQRGDTSWPEYIKTRVVSTITTARVSDRLEFLRHSLLIRLRRKGTAQDLERTY